ncbi:unnamed protein product, partial [Closterium sp. NIES-53]
RRAWGSCLEDGVLLSSLVTQTLHGLTTRSFFLTAAAFATSARIVAPSFVRRDRCPQLLLLP